MLLGANRFTVTWVANTIDCDSQFRAQTKLLSPWPPSEDVYRPPFSLDRDHVPLKFNSYKGRSRSVDPSWRLILCGLAILSALISNMKQLSAEACPLRNYSQNIFSPYGKVRVMQNYSVSYFSCKNTFLDSVFKADHENLVNFSIGAKSWWRKMQNTGRVSKFAKNACLWKSNLQFFTVLLFILINMIFKFLI